MIRRGGYLLGWAGLLLVLGLLAAPGAGADQRIFISNYVSGSIVQANVDRSGDIDPLQALVTGSASLEGVAVSPGGKFLYAAGTSDGRLYGYEVEKGGGLVPVPGAPVDYAAGTGISPVVTPDGKNLFVSAPDANRVFGFDLDSDGSPVPTSSTSTSPGFAPAPNGLAISPSGKLLFSAGTNTGSPGSGFITIFKVGSGGKLNEIAGGPVETGLEPYALSVSPDGKHLYVADRGSPAFIHAYSIASGGGLAELADSPYPADGANPFGMAISPDGLSLYTANYNSDTISGFAIESDGDLTALPGSVYAGPTNPAALSFTASGETMFAVSGTNFGLGVFGFEEGGVPAPIVLSLFSAPGDFQSVALTPAQPPKAKLKAKRKVKVGRAVKLSAKKSSDDGDVVEYAWRFGDGERTFTMRPRVTHTYGRKGRYKVTVTLTDDDGCSTKYVASGQTAYCNGSERAKASKKIKVEK